MKKSNPFFALICLMVLASCGSKQQQITEDSQKADTVEETTPDGEREPTDDEISEYGLITVVEDGAYPMFSITMEFPERGISASFGISIEESHLDVESLMAARGKYATVYYTIDDDPAMVNIVRDCEPIWGPMEMASDGLKEITGILSGANALSGDLPRKVTVTATDGTKVEFNHFIDEAMIKVNGEEVTVFYYESFNQTLTYLQISAED